MGWSEDLNREIGAPHAAQRTACSAAQKHSAHACQAAPCTGCNGPWCKMQPGMMRRAIRRQRDLQHARARAHALTQEHTHTHTGGARQSEPIPAHDLRWQAAARAVPGFARACLAANGCMRSPGLTRSTAKPTSGPALRCHGAAYEPRDRRGVAVASPHVCQDRVLALNTDRPTERRRGIVRRSAPLASRLR